MEPLKKELKKSGVNYLCVSMVVKKSEAHGGDFWNGYFERFSVFDFARESKVRYVSTSLKFQPALPC